MNQDDLEAAVVRAACVLDSIWEPDGERDLRSWAYELAKDSRALLAEVERLTRIVNGYDRTPAEQRSAEAEAEVDSLRAGNGQIRGDLARLRAENAGLRESMLKQMEHYEKAADRCCAPTEPVIDSGWLCEVHLHHTCGAGPGRGYGCEPGCGLVPLVNLAELEGWPVNATDAPRTAPVAANGPGVALGDALLTIEPDVSGFDDAGEGQA